MIAADLINDMIPPIKTTDEASKAMLWMEELRLTELPVVEKQRFLGFIAEDIIIDENTLEKIVSDYPLKGQSCFLSEGRHVYDVLKMATEHELNSVAIINHEGHYAGVVSVQDTLSVFANSATIQNPGGVLIIAMNNRDYALSEISRLVESDDAKIIGSFLTSDPNDPEKIHLTLKINKIDLSHVIATLERFSYKIIAHFQEVVNKSNEKERLDILLKYLSI